MAMPRIRQNISDIDLFSPRQVVFGWVEYPPGGRLGPRVQADVQLVMVDAGSARVSTDGQTRPVRPGDVVCQWPGGSESFAFDVDVPTTHRWIALSFAPDPAGRAWVGAKRTGAPRIRDETPTMRRLFDTAFDLPDDDPAAAVTRTHLALAYLAAYLQPLAEQSAADRSPPPPVLGVMQAVIAERFAEPLALGDLADAASVTPNHLARLCRKHLDTTPMELLWRTRVDQGLYLLRSTGLTVGEIAYRVGFTNPFHFSRRFKETHGLSPRDFRQRIWRAED